MTHTIRSRCCGGRNRSISAPRLHAVQLTALLLITVVATASASETHTERVVFEGLGCGQERMQVFVRALAAAQELGFETRDVDGDEGTFEGRLKQPGRRIRLDAEVTCSGVPSGEHDAFEAFFGPPRVTVEAVFKARRGGRPAAQADGERFRARLGELMQAYLPPRSCLGVTIGDAGELSPDTRRRLDVTSGVIVREVARGGPAAAAELAPWDVIVGIDGVETPSAGSLRQVLHRRSAGDSVALLVSRGGETVRASVILGRRGDDGSCIPNDGNAPSRPHAPPPSPPRDRLALGDLVVRPQPVPPGDPFDVELTIDLVSSAAGGEPVDVALTVEILHDETSLFSSAPETVASRSGAVTTAVKHLRAGHEPGDYELRVSVELGLLRDERTVALEIR